MHRFDDQWVAALSELHERLRRIGVDWVLIGSSNLVARGAPVTPGDIDVLVGDGSLADVVHALAGLHVTRVEASKPPFHSEWLLRTTVEGVEIELMSGTVVTIEDRPCRLSAAPTDHVELGHRSIGLASIDEWAVVCDAVGSKHAETAVGLSNAAAMAAVRDRWGLAAG